MAMQQRRRNYDYSKLCGKIVEILGTRSKFAEKLGRSERSISLKLNNKIPFDQYEISQAVELLSIDSADMFVYFFLRVKFCLIELFIKKRKNEKIEKRQKNGKNL
jgi:hypothetical protein